MSADAPVHAADPTDPAGPTDPTNPTGPTGPAQPAPRRRGRPPAGAGTRDLVLQAARAEFTERGYEAATLRAVARRAGVDPRTVHHHFEGKEHLFVEAMGFPARPALVLSSFTEHLTGEIMVRTFFGIWEQPSAHVFLTATIGAAAANETLAATMREFVTREFIGPISARWSAPDARLRLELAVAQLLGAALLRYVLRVEPLASATVDELVVVLAPAVQRQLDALAGR